MLITSQPASWNHFDSARVEKRGPWIVTTVPPSWTGIPSSLAVSTSSARRSGQYGSAAETCVVSGAVVEGVRTAARAVDELVADDELAEPQLRFQRPGGVRPDDAADAELLHPPDIRSIGDRVRRQLVIGPMTRQEGDALALELTEHKRPRRLAVRGLELHLLDVVEERVEARAPEDPDLCARHPAAKPTAREGTSPLVTPSEPESYRRIAAEVLARCRALPDDAALLLHSRLEVVEVPDLAVPALDRRASDEIG